jgi:hypothetical protein
MMKRFIATCVTAALLAGCGGGEGSQQASPGPALRNPLDFPLYSNASLISSKSFTQIVRADTSSSTSVFAQGNGKYTGHEVIASSPASFGALSQWVEHLNSSPPSGYTAVEDRGNPDQQAQAQRYGLDYAVFKKKAANGTRGVLVIVMDPQRVNARFGTILGMIDKYRALPQMFRTPIDNEAKARFGMTITQATQPDSPIGAALGALGELEHKNARGIVVLDAQKV